MLLQTSIAPEKKQPSRTPRGDPALPFLALRERSADWPAVARLSRGNSKFRFFGILLFGVVSVSYARTVASSSWGER